MQELIEHDLYLELKQNNNDKKTNFLFFKDSFFFFTAKTKIREKTYLQRLKIYLNYLLLFLFVETSHEVGFDVFDTSTLSAWLCFDRILL